MHVEASGRRPRSALLVAAVLRIALGAGVRARLPGTAVIAGTLTISLVWFGYWSATYPGHAGGAGSAGGLTMVIAAGVFAVVVGWQLCTSRGVRAPARHRGAGVDR